MRRAALLFCALAPTVSAVAQGTNFDVSWTRGTPAARQIQVRMLPTPGSSRIGGYGYVTLELESRDGGRAHQVELRLASHPYASSNFSVRKTLGLDEGGRATVHLPLPGLMDGCSLTVRVDGYGGNPVQSLSTRPANPGPSVLMVGAEGARSLSWQTSLQAELNRASTGAATGRPGRRSRSSGTTFNFAVRLPQQLPDQWTLLSGFDLVILDGGAPDLQGTHQELLRRYLAAGGALQIVRSQLLPEGAIADLVQRAADEDRPPQGRHALGRWLATDGPVESRVQSWWGESPRGVLVTAAGRHGPVPTQLHDQLLIPGLGAVPVHLFFVLILGFAILVGPVNQFYFSRRRRKPLMLLITVPALGFGFTALILVYGVFSEGFGVSGRIRSLTVLDQHNHDATTVASRTLYAGLSPSHVTPASRTYLFSSQFWGSWSSPRNHGLHIDMDRGGRLDGEALPSRTLTEFVTVTQGTSRERIRFRRLPDGSLEVLAGPDFAPLPGGQSLILRDLDGNYYVADEGNAVLRQVSRQEFGRLLSGLRSGFPDRRGLANVWLREVLPKELPRGSYLAFVKHAPDVDDLGLEVDYLGEQHLVLGHLDAEDFVD